MATLKINDINKNFGKTEVLKGINLDIGDGDFLVLLGSMAWFSTACFYHVFCLLVFSSFFLPVLLSCTPRRAT